MRVLMIDNYDSCVYNLVQMLGQQGAEVVVYRNDQVTLDKARSLRPDRIVISPGPGNPQDEQDFGICAQILRCLSPRIKTLGVCLGHQGIFSAFGGRIIRARRLMHGKTSLIGHDGKGVFTGLENPFHATRYHSLVGDGATIPPCLKVTARSVDDQEIMGVRHTKYPLEGVQFHPESILTTSGERIIANFLDGD